MNETKIYLVRHAHSSYTPDEYGRGLSPKGNRDEKSLTYLMKEKQIDVVLSSPYNRAIHTVEGIAKHHSIDIQVIEAFKERTLAEQPVEDFQSAIDAVWQDETFSHPGGESNEFARSRGVSALQNALKTYKGKSVVIGTHGNLMVLIMRHFDDQYDRHFWKNLDMPDVYCLTFQGEELMNVERIWKRTA